MPAFMKSLRSYGPYAVLVIIAGYIFLYANLLAKTQKVKLQQVTTQPPSRFALVSNITKLNEELHAPTISVNSSSKAEVVKSPKIKRSSSSKSRKKKVKKKKTKLIVLQELNLRSELEVTEDLKKVYDLNDLASAPNCSSWNNTDMPPYTRLCEQKNVDKKPLITLFTTIHYSIKEYNITLNTLRLWQQLGPKVRRILFVSSPYIERHLVAKACNADWDVMTAPLCDDNNKLPVLKAMFMAAQQIQTSDFYGYANGDILYDETLLKTLDFIRANYLKYFNRTLFVGSRTNIRVERNKTIADLKELRVLAKNGTDGWVAAIDYFITSRNGFEWDKIPKIVIGRIAYDNWMINNAKKKMYAVFDITNTTLSVHQIIVGAGYYASHNRRDGNLNNKLMGGFDFTKGLISCGQFKTKIENNMIRLKKRIKYGMCGYGHWGKRNINRYGDEVLTDYEPEMGVL